MTEHAYLKNFVEAAHRVGAEVTECRDLSQAMEYIASKSSGKVLIPETVLAKRHELRKLGAKAGAEVFTGRFRQAGRVPGAGVTFCNFAMADTGTVVLDSTDEDIRLATTLPEKHFVIVDPEKILKDNLAATPPMTAMHSGHEPRFVAYITGPSRTADIERVLTIGCHGPRELHILVVESVSGDLMEM